MHSCRAARVVGPPPSVVAVGMSTVDLFGDIDADLALTAT